MPARLRCRARQAHPSGALSPLPKNAGREKTDATSSMEEKPEAPAQAPMTAHMEEFAGESKEIHVAVRRGGLATGGGALALMSQRPDDGFIYLWASPRSSLRRPVR